MNGKFWLARGRGTLTYFDAISQSFSHSFIRAEEKVEFGEGMGSRFCEDVALLRPGTGPRIASVFSSRRPLQTENFKGR